jgi:hypothetical protein
MELVDELGQVTVPVDTTIGALRSLLTTLVPTHPTPDRMRLIYAGRLVADDNQTLAHLFGPAALTQTTPFILHLVVRAPPSPVETAATRQSIFSSNANILPPGASQHPLLPPGAAFVPQPLQVVPGPSAPRLVRATPSNHALQSQQPLGDAREVHQQPLRDAREVFQQPLRDARVVFQQPLRDGREVLRDAREVHQHPNVHAHPQPAALHQQHVHAFQPPRPNAQHAHQHASQGYIPPHQHANYPAHQHQQHVHPQRHATITINQGTFAMPMHMPLGPDGIPLPPPGFPNTHHLFHVPQPNAQPFNPAAPIVYLLSSPAGPHAIVFSSQGTYSTNPPHGPNARAILGTSTMPNPFYPPSRTHTPAAQPAQLPRAFQPPPGFHPLPAFHPQPAPEQPALNPQPAPEQPAPEQPAQQLVPHENQAAQDNQQVDLLAQWQPMIAQGWMLLRLMFFAWILLGTGQGWRRPLALVIIAAVFWAINAGGIGNNMRDAVRAWWESVVGLPGQPQVQQDHGVIRQTLRPAERLLALLIASLWPGVGERTVTARREAEERQRREEGERQQAEAERQRLLEANQTAASQETTTTNMENSSTVATGQQPSATASGTDVAAARQEVRERNTAIAGPSAGQPTMSREEQAAQQLNNLTADW